MKKINNKKTVILLIFCILLGIISYCVYFYNSKMYKDFEEAENIPELIPYEEEKQNTEVSKNTKTSQSTDTSQNSDESRGSDTSESLDENENSKLDIEKNNTNEEVIIIHITGAVRNWGIIELPANSRIADAIEKAGGLTEDADITNVNLAYVLEDGMKVDIPSINKEEVNSNDFTTTQSVENYNSSSNDFNNSQNGYITKENGNNIVTPSTGTNTSKSKVIIVNINTATQTELETLPGIGTSTALKIINYRNEHGRFTNIEDIKNVNGIGDTKFDNIKKLICV